MERKLVTMGRFEQLLNWGYLQPVVAELGVLITLLSSPPMNFEVLASQMKTSLSRARAAD